MAEKGSEVEELEHMLERMSTNEIVEPVQMSYSVIQSITKNFCQVVGHGGFGIVYLGALRNDVMVAVKQLHPSQDISDTQFMAEVKCLTGVNHENIVKFLGYCAYLHEVVMKVEGKDMMVVNERKRFLCFEYAPNGNLHDYLQEKIHGYQWSIRYKIIKGICHGLHYLHQKRINHLDLKPANVLLGAQMEPKITDFGLSRCNDGTQSTIVTCNLKGTLGYMAPELIDGGKISSKSDIFSLGIIMTRLLMGSNENIAENWHESLNVECQLMERCIEVARICSDNDPTKRPTTADIISMLTEMETSIQNIPPVIITEPRNDPTSTLYKNVKIFLSRKGETHESHRWPEKLPVERPKWKLKFLSQPKLPIYTREKIEDANYNPLEVILVNAETGKPSALPNVLQIELVPLLGNFPRDCWDVDDFQRGVVEDLEGDRPLLAGEHRLIMWDGRALLNKFFFTCGSHMCGCMFRIGVRVLPGSYRGPRILEAMTGAFMVKDRHDDELHYNRHYKWQLAFQSQPQLPIRIGSRIRDVIGNPLEIVLVDMETGSPLALPMAMDIRLVSLIGASLPLNWTVMDPRLVKGELAGDIRLTMRNGCVTVNELQFADILQLSGEFRIGVCVVLGSYDGPERILDGMTKAFKIDDIPTEITKKHYPPALDDEVWRLEGIAWGEVLHKRLAQNSIRNVQEFLMMLTVKPDELRAIMDDNMEDDNIWDVITRHARRCVVPFDKAYAYSAAHVIIYVNTIFELVKVDFGGAECPLPQRLVQQVTREAYEHRHSLQEVKLTLKLAFKSPPQLPIYTGSIITDATGNPLEIILVDAKTGSPLALSMELKIQLVPLYGDFLSDDVKEDWSAEEFRTAIVNPRQENVPLLKGYERYFPPLQRYLPDDVIIMSDGRVTVGELLQFTDDSSWVHCRKFRMGAHVVPRPGYDDGCCRIVEAITEAFVVEDLNRKHYPPILGDPVWRLEMIDKDGELHRKLTGNNIDTVQEFRRMLQIQPDELRAILGCSKIDLLWKTMIDHAGTCDPGDTMYAYIGENGTIYVDSVFGRLAIVIDGVECPLKLEHLDKAQQILVLELILEAYEQRHNLQAMEICDYETMDPSPLLYSARHKMSTFSPVHSDEVWMLKGITWGGVFHKRLRQNNVRNVEDFVRMLAVKSEELRTIMGGDGGDNDGTWESITHRARRWVNPGAKVYTYSTVHVTIYVDSVFHLVKVEFGGVQCPLQQLDEDQKRLVQQAMREAYEHRRSLQEVDLEWKLAFKSPPRLPIHTGSRIVDSMGNPLEIILVDAKTGSPLVLPNELHIELVPLLGNFITQDCSAEEFEKAIVEGRHEDVPLLKGGNFLTMRDGRATVDILHFTDDSSWAPRRMFRIGAQFAPWGRDDESFRIIEAVTEAFEVGDLNRKHYPPVLADPVWRLEMIDKDGPVHRELTRNNIHTVQEFCRMRNVKHDELRAIVGDGMTDRMWDMTTEHASDCSCGEKVYAYSGANGTVYVDSIFRRLFKMQIDGVECRPLHELPDNKVQTMLARQLILEAYEHRHNLQEVDANMKLCKDNAICIDDLLDWAAEVYELHESLKFHFQAQPLVDKDEDPAAQASNMSHQGPSQAESSSAS